MKIQTFFLQEAIKGAYKIPFFELARRSPRFIDLIPMHPIRTGLSVTHNCNSRCITCSHWKSQSQDDLTLTELVDILHQLKAFGVIDLNFTGGEPLLRDDLPAIVRGAHDLKFKRIGITTNGLLLTREKIEQLVENGLTSIYTSLNGGEAVHDTTRGIKGAYARTTEAIRTLVELRNSKFPHLQITVQAIVMGTTVNQIMDIANMCCHLGIGLSLSPLNTTRPWQLDMNPDLNSVNQEQLDHMVAKLHRLKKAHPALIRDNHTSLEYIKRYFIDRTRKDIPCYLGFLTIAIKPDGDVLTGVCSAFPPAGNLRQASLRQIVDSKAYRDNVKGMFFKNCRGCGCDHILNLYAHFPAIVEEIKWKFSQSLSQNPKST